MTWYSFTAFNLTLNSWVALNLKVFIMAVRSDGHVTFEGGVCRPDARHVTRGVSVCACASLCLRLRDRQRRQVIKRDNASGPELWTLGDGDTQRDGVIGGRRCRRARGQWVKLFVSLSRKPRQMTSKYFFWKHLVSFCTVVVEVALPLLAFSLVSTTNTSGWRCCWSQEFIHARLQTMQPRGERLHPPLNTRILLSKGFYQECELSHVHESTTVVLNDALLCKWLHKYIFYDKR